MSSNRSSSQGAASASAAPANADGDAGLGDMMPRAYDELRRLATHYLRGERIEHTLQPTALVHEAYLRLLGNGETRWKSRAHFLAFAARTMRHILINYAVARNRVKRGGENAVKVTLDEALGFYDERDIGITAVDEALRSLEAVDARQARVVELRFFGGLTIEEIAEVLEISPATVKREWATAKLWLRSELSSTTTG
jgi:RNA polymerase sigma factor (TIGR02999 family)